MEVNYPNWFEVTAKSNFDTFLKDLKNKSNLKFLQLGVYTGDASLWICENIFFDETCSLTDVDTWLGSDEDAHRKINFNDVFTVYKNKIKKYSSTIKIKKEYTLSFLANELTSLENNYDFIYIDADHKAASVLVDAELSWPLLKSGGIMAFDDYNWGARLPEFERPKTGIDLFLNKYKNKFNILTINQQVWIQKN